MASNRAFAASALLSLCCSVPALAQDYVQSPRTYYLHAPSSYQQGCWGPCACVLSAREAMLGSFTLDLVTVGDATDFYSVTDVAWRVPTVMGQSVNMLIDGPGSFGAGQVPFATHQNMSLNLTLLPAPGPWSNPQEFNTTATAYQRTVAPPVIDIEVANSTTGCPGIRLRIVASWFKSDFNGDGTIAVADIFDFLDAWFDGDLRTDFDDSGSLAPLDIFAFLNAWFAGA